MWAWLARGVANGGFPLPERLAVLPVTGSAILPRF